MGIPSYYKNIIENYPNIVSLNLNNKNIDNIFFDLNCAIHPCCKNKTNENEMYIDILNKIKECIILTNVKNCVYLLIDGTAPKMKMIQQRQRRLKSIRENKIWNTNNITPGTKFMNNLNLFLEKNLPILIKEINQNLKFVISDSNSPGEGEHKIMDIIDHLNSNTINIIYGLDADLIMLSMIRNHNIFLLRETTDYNIENVDSKYIFCNINLLKYHIIQDIKSNNIIINISDNQLLFDYLFICFFLGNDFIIHSPSLILRYNGLNNILNIYKNLQSDHSGYFFILDENKKINLNNLKLFIHNLSIHEKNNLKHILKIRNIQEYKLKKYIHKNHKDYNLNYPILNRNDEKLIFNNLDNYNTKYYLFNIYNTHNYNPSYDQLLIHIKNNISFEYLKSLFWTVDYYFHKKTHWTYDYPYHFSPLSIDLFNYLNNNDSIDFNFKIDKPYSTKNQLKFVLPLQNNSYYYPKYVPSYNLLKRYDWECHLILPSF